MAFSPSIRQLNLCDNSLNQTRYANESNVDLLVKFMKSMEHNHVLIDLDISENSLQSFSARYVSKMLCKNRTLRRLNLSGTSIQSEGVAFLSDGLRHNNTLEYLNLSRIVVDVDGSRSLARALESNQSLRELVLADSRLWSEGVAALCRSAAKSSSLESLDLSNTYFFAEAFTCQTFERYTVRRALKNRDSHHKTWVHSEIGLNALCEGLSEGFDSLCRLTLGRNHFNDTLALTLSRSLVSRQRRQLDLRRHDEDNSTQTQELEIDLSNNEIGAVGMNQLLAMAEESRIPRKATDADPTLMRNCTVQLNVYAGLAPERLCVHLEKNLVNVSKIKQSIEEATRRREASLLTRSNWSAKEVSSCVTIQSSIRMYLSVQIAISMIRLRFRKLYDGLSVTYVDKITGHVLYDKPKLLGSKTFERSDKWTRDEICAAVRIQTQMRMYLARTMMLYMTRTLYEVCGEKYEDEKRVVKIYRHRDNGRVITKLPHPVVPDRWF